MSFCKLCQKDTEKYKVKIILGEVDPPKRVGIDMRYKTNAEVCPFCGLMTVMGADLDYMKMLSNGYPAITKKDLDSIDVKSLLNEMTLPGTHSEEVKIWVEIENFHEGELDDLSHGITFDKDNYYRLIHFLNLDVQKRQNSFGTFKCPVIRLDIENRSGSFKIVDGRRRLSLLYYLGAKRIPVSILKKELDDINARGLGITYYTSIMSRTKKGSL